MNLRLISIVILVTTIAFACMKNHTNESSSFLDVPVVNQQLKNKDNVVVYARNSFLSIAELIAEKDERNYWIKIRRDSGRYSDLYVPKDSVEAPDYTSKGEIVVYIRSGVKYGKDFEVQFKTTKHVLLKSVKNKQLFLTDITSIKKKLKSKDIKDSKK